MNNPNNPYFGSVPVIGGAVVGGGIHNVLRNPIFLTDWYNLSHQNLKINTDFETMHFYVRAGDGMIVTGQSEMIEAVINRIFTHEMVDEMAIKSKGKGPRFPEEIFRRVVDELGGWLPLDIEIVAEGSWVPCGSPFMQVSNTVEGYGELVSWFEDIMLMTWFPSTCATEFFKMYKYLMETKKEFGFDDSYDWRFHSFAYRSHRSPWDAYWCGTRWSMFFKGTDDIAVLMHLPDDAVVGSISALAHKVVQQFDVELDCFLHAIKAVYKMNEKTVALVIDTYDTDRVINEYIFEIAKLAKNLGIHIVFRPDSGNVIGQALDIWAVCQREGIDNITVIIGEGMSFETVKEYDAILRSFMVPLNFVFYGIGGGSHAHLTRDTLSIAGKCSFSNGKPRMKFSENPIKRSIPGRVNLFLDDNGKMYVDLAEGKTGGLYEKIYFYDGKEMPYVRVYTWTETRDRALKQTGYQTVIKLSDDIKNLMAEIEKQHFTVGV